MNCEMAIKHDRKTMTNHRFFWGPQIFFGALGLNKPISDPSTAEHLASRADGHGREYLEFSFGHLDLDDENDVQSFGHSEANHQFNTVHCGKFQPN